METGNEVIAHSILDELAAEIDSRRLEEWEPVEAVAHPLLLLYPCSPAAGQREPGGESPVRQDLPNSIPGRRIASVSR
jgi:hypothetical protein